MPTVLAVEEVWALEVSQEVTFVFKSLEGGFCFKCASNKRQTRTEAFGCIFRSSSLFSTR